jgi:integral membrane protein (TIGR01906 family)
MKRFVQILLVVLFPFFVLLAWVRIMLFPVFVQVEYQRAGFPPDPYGFTTRERIHWAEVSAAYLLSAEGPDYFSQFTLPGGSPLYNEREAKHMADVHDLVQKGMVLLGILAGAYLLGGAFLFWKDRTALWKTLSRAGKAALALLLTVLVVVALAWNWAFVAFHEVFFTGGTWMFPYSDTLIRLFPETFWQDGFASAVIGMLATCLLVWFASAKIPSWIARHGRPSAPKS